MSSVLGISPGDVEPASHGRWARVQHAAGRAAPWFALLMAFGIPWSRFSYRVGLIGLLTCFALSFSWTRTVQTVRREPLAQLSVVLFIWIASGLLWTTAPAELAAHDVSRYVKLLALVPLLVMLPAHWALRLLGAYMAGVGVLMLPTLLDGSGAATLLHLDLTSWRNLAYKAEPPISLVYWRSYLVHGVHVITLAMMSLVLIRYHPTLRPGLGALLVLCAIDVLFLIHGRSALLLFTGLVGLFVLLWLPRWRQRVLACTLLVAMAVVIWALSPRVQERVHSIPAEVRGFTQGDVTSGAGSRLQFWKRSLDMWVEAPLAGTGPGSFRSRLLGSDEPQLIKIYWHTHNEYLTQASQHGLVGLALLVALLVLAWRTAGRAAPLQRDLARWSLAVFALSALTDSSLHNEWEGWTFVLWLWLASAGRRQASGGSA